MIKRRRECSEDGRKETYQEVQEIMGEGTREDRSVDYKKLDKRKEKYNEKRRML